MAAKVYPAGVRTSARSLCAIKENRIGFYVMVPGAGLEPARPFGQEILSLQCLPIPPPGRALEPRGYTSQ